MVKIKLLFCIMLLMAGVSLNAQSVAEEQMDERFNDGTTMPYGWFGEGWKVDDGVAQSKAIKESNNGMPGMGGGQGTGTGTGMGGGQGYGMNMFGGDHIRTYLLTPPVEVQNGEKLVFKARKPASEGGFSFDLKAIMGFSDTLFVVDRSVYGTDQWVRVGDVTTALTDDFQEFTISDTPEGKYRFRLVSYVDAEVDSVAGFHIDSEAPDLLVTVDSLHTQFVDYSVCAEDSTKEFIVINSGTGTLDVNITSDAPDLFSVDMSQVSVAAGDSATVNVTFHYDAGTIGKNEGLIRFRSESDSHPLLSTTIRAAAIITDPEAWFVDFNDDQLPLGCYGEGFVVKDSVATHYNPDGGGMAAMGAIFGGGGASDWFMTPPLTIRDENDAVVFQLRNGDGSYKGPIIDPQANVTIEKSVYGSNKWERVDAYQFKDTLAHVKWVSYLPQGNYRFRFVSGDSLCIDSIAGGRLLMNAPDLLVRENGRSVQTVNYGVARNNQTKTFQLINTGTAALQVYAMSSDPTFYTINEQLFNIPAGESATIDVTFNHNPEALGAHQAALVLVPQNAQIATQMIYLSAYITYDNAWSEDFEPEFIVEEGETVYLPAGWSTTGWQVAKGGGMDLMAMMGMGGAEKTWAPHTDSEAYELITPRLQAQKGDVLRFYADVSSGWLNLFYKRDADADWTYQNTYITADSIYFIAPLSGVYQLKFTGSSVSVDDFLGFLRPMEEAALQDNNDEINALVMEHYQGQKVNVVYDRVLSAVQNEDGSYTPKAYTLCLPYDFRFGELVEPGKIRFYQLSFVDDYYKQFVFTAVNDVAEAGKAYLAVVEHGDVRLDAINVEMILEPFSDDEHTAVNDYAEWFFNENLNKVGNWAGNFTSISAEEANGLNMFCLLDDGTWARFTSADNPNATLNAFRGYFLSDAPASASAKAPAQGNTNKLYRTLFNNAGVGTVSDGNVPDAANILYNPDIPTPTSEPSGIESIETIEADGTHRYFDLLGRPLLHKPEQGVYIDNGQKVIVK